MTQWFDSIKLRLTGILPAVEGVPRSPSILAGAWCVLFVAKLLAAYALARPPYSDETVYLAIAEHLVRGDGYRGLHGQLTACVVPGYPLLLAGVLAAGVGIWPMVGLNVLLSAIGAAAAGALVWLWTKHRSLAHGSALLVFVLPPYFQYAGRLMTEIPYFAWLMLSLLSWESCRAKEAGLRSWVALGVFHGCAITTRPVTFALTPFILLWPIVERRLSRTSLIGGGVAAGLVAIIWAPWAVRNYRVFGEFVPLSTLSGFALMGGSLADQTLWEAEGAKAHRAGGIARWQDDEARANRLITEAAKDNIRADRLGYTLRSAKNAWRFWVLEYPTYFGLEGATRGYLAEGRYGFFLAKLGLAALNALIPVLTAIASVYLIRRVKYLPYVLILVYFTAVHALLIPVARYSVPVQGLAVILFVAAVFEVRRGRRTA